MKSRPRLVALLAMLSCAGSSAIVLGQQRVPRDTAPARSANAQVNRGAIRGQVISTNTGAPLRRVHVSLVGGSAQIIYQGGTEPPVVLTDDQGRFAFNNIAAGRYSLTAAKAGYATLAYGQSRPGEAGKEIDVRNNAVFDGANISLPAAGVIVARVTDDLGDPVVGVDVFAQQQRFVDGERQLVAVSRGVTDVGGERRLSGLLPGTYYVSAEPSRLAADGRRVFGPTYYPGTDSRSSALPVKVAIGEEVRAPFALSAVRLARVSGTLRTSDGSIGVAQTMRLVDLAAGASPRGISQRPDGSFSITNVLPGEYVIQVEPSPAPGATKEYASLPLRVFGEDISIDVLTSRGGSARGRFVFDPSVPAELRPGTLLVAASPLQRVGGRGPQSRSSSTDWTFDVDGLTGPVLFRLAPVTGAAASVPEWHLKTVMLDGVDVTDTPVDFSGDRSIDKLSVVVSREKTTVSGTAVDSNGSPVADYVAVLFPEDRRMRTGQSRYIAAARPDQRGNFTITGLPPGRYLSAAIDYLPPGEERDPELLDRLEVNGTPIILHDAESTVLKLRVTAY